MIAFLLAQRGPVVMTWLAAILVPCRELARVVPVSGHKSEKRRGVSGWRNISTCPGFVLCVVPVKIDELDLSRLPVAGSAGAWIAINRIVRSYLHWDSVTTLHQSLSEWSTWSVLFCGRRWRVSGPSHVVFLRNHFLDRESGV